MRVRVRVRVRVRALVRACCGGPATLGASLISPPLRSERLQVTVADALAHGLQAFPDRVDLLSRQSELDAVGELPNRLIGMDVGRRGHRAQHAAAVVAQLADDAELVEIRAGDLAQALDRP